MRSRVMLVACMLASCRQLDRSAKIACVQSSDCAAIGSSCVSGTCLGGDAAPGGQACFADVLCPDDAFCDRGTCRSFVVRDYGQTREAFAQLVCASMRAACGDAAMSAFFGANADASCPSRLHETAWDLRLGPANLQPKYYDPKRAAACLAETDRMLRVGEKAPYFSRVPASCNALALSSFGLDNGCGDGAASCGSIYSCGSPPLQSASDEEKATCNSPGAKFGETCFASGAIVQECAVELFCDVATTHSCLKRPLLGERCTAIAFCDDPAQPRCRRVFDPCADGLLCDAGACQPSVARCPL